MNNYFKGFLSLITLSLVLMNGAGADKLHRVSPEKAGFDSKRLALIDKKFRHYIDEGKTSGLIGAIANKKSVSYLKSFGYQDIEGKLPMTEDTLFRIYSMSKPIVAVALMTLYEEGKFHLKDPISKYLPEFTHLKVLKSVNGDEVELEDVDHIPTIQELMTHTAGFTYGVFGNTAVDKMYREAGLLQTPEHTLADFTEKLAALPLLYQPGSRWVYSVSVDVQGRLIEVLSGQSLETFLQERIFEPLGMKDTGFYVPAHKLHRLAVAYNNDPKTGDLVVYDPQDGQFSKAPNMASGGGGLVSSTGDYLRFGQMLLNHGSLKGERIIGRKTLELMTSNHIPHLNDGTTVTPNSGVSSSSFGFGLGFGIDLNVPGTGAAGSVGSYFWGGLASTIFWIDPQEEFMGLVMTQLLPSGTLPLREDFKVLTYQALK